VTWSITPLVEALHLEPGASVAKALGISGASLQRYAEQGLDDRQADRLATRVGLHPFTVWPEMADAIVAEGDRLLAEEAAEVERKAEERRAKRAADERRRFHEDPEYAERVRARRRRYYAENGAYERARQRRYHHANRERELERMRTRKADRKKAS